MDAAPRSEAEVREARRVAEVAERAERRAAERAAAAAAAAGATAAPGAAVAGPRFMSKAERERLRAAAAAAKGKKGKGAGLVKAAPRGGSGDVEKKKKKKKKEHEDEVPLTQEERERVAVIKAQYAAPEERKAAAVQAGRPPARKRGKQSRFDSSRLEWEPSEDTMARDVDPLYTQRAEARRQSKDDAMLDRVANGKRQRRQLHWRDKALEEMTERDWRIVREDFDINVKGKRAAKPARSWEEMGLPEAVLEAVRRAGYTKPFAIQMQAIPIGLGWRDMVGVAETGSGKTAAFIIPMLVNLSRQPPEALAACNEDGPLGVVMGPTRELVQQIGKETSKLAAGLGFRTAVVVGGNSIQDQISELRKGCQIVAATPGRLLDCLENRYVVFNQCCFLVLDEADRMIDMGFTPQVEAVIKNTRTREKAGTEEEVAEQEERAARGEELVRVTYMFTATMEPEVEQLALRYLRYPVVVRIGDASSGKNKRIEQRVFVLPSQGHKRRKLLQLVRETAPPIIVFANSKVGCDEVAAMLEEGGGQRCAVLHGGKQQSAREASLAGFKSGRFGVLVATDVAGRGLDISDVTHVINYEMATEIERYSHRIGRTGRAGKSGLASTLLTTADSAIFRDLARYLKATGATVPRELLALDEIIS